MDDLDGVAWLREHPLVFVEDLEHPAIAHEDLHHLRRSRRLSDGSPITVTDGRGSWCAARLAEVAEPLAEIRTEPAPVWPITVAFTPVKGQKPEWVVQKLTELGVDRIVPLETERSVVRWDSDRRDRRQHRWSKVVREAAMQSRRLRLPTVEGVTTPAALVATAAAGEVALAEPGGDRLGPGDRIVLVGPEGGWSEAERALARHVSLPGGVLRAETAAVVAAALLGDRRDDRIRGG